MKKNKYGRRNFIKTMGAATVGGLLGVNNISCDIPDEVPPLRNPVNI